MSVKKKAGAGVALESLTVEPVDPTEALEATTEDSSEVPLDEAPAGDVVESSDATDESGGDPPPPPPPAEPVEGVYRVAKGKSVTCRKGIVNEDEPFEARFIADGPLGEAAFAELVERGVVVKG